MKQDKFSPYNKQDNNTECRPRSISCGLGRGLRGRTDGRAGTSKAWQTDGRADGQADGPNRARFWLVYIKSNLSLCVSVLCCLCTATVLSGYARYLVCGILTSSWGNGQREPLEPAGSRFARRTYVAANHDHGHLSSGAQRQLRLEIRNKRVASAADRAPYARESSALGARVERQYQPECGSRGLHMGRA